jgi:hypothetical protein
MVSAECEDPHAAARVSSINYCLFLGVTHSKKHKMSNHTSSAALLRTFEDLESQESAEHISMGSTQATVTSKADTTSAVELNKVSAEFQIANHLHGTRFRYVLYEEGYLKIYKWKNKKLVREYYLSLRFMTPEYKVTRVVAKQTIYAAAGLLAAGIISALLATVTPWDGIFRPAAILAGTGAAISFMLFLYRSHERTHFFTRVGRCEVLKLMGSADSYRSCRSMAPVIAKAIEDARAHNNRTEERYYREEMHEHYRLERADIITPEDCSASTRRILAKFS